MIGFKELLPDKIRLTANELSLQIDTADREYIEEILSSFASLTEENPDTGAAFALCCDCLLVRIFDMGRYSFVYPIPLTDKAVESAAVEEIRKYAVKEEIPLVFSDVPASCVGELVTTFRHTETDAEDPERSSFKVRAISEAMLLDYAPEASFGELALSLLTREDISDYAALCRDETVNKYWGYDFREDIKDPPDSYFIDEATSEYNRGVSLPLSVRYKGRFIGEAVIHAFDLRGGADLGFRLLPEWQGRGLGTHVVSACMELAGKIGLIRLFGRVMAENERSVRLMSRFAEGQPDGDILVFELDLI